MGQDLSFTVHQAGRSQPRAFRIDRAVIAGWTGRDAAARDHHIAELEALGIARPATTPIFYRVAAARLTFASVIEVVGEESSGEVEFVLIGQGGRSFVGVGSDHTDRKVEAYGVTVSKQMCDKPLAPELWALDEVAPHWDRIVLRSHAIVEGRRDLYQEGSLSGMLAPSDLVEQGFAGSLPDGCALFGGTFPAKGGIRAAGRFEIEIDDPVLGRTLRHGYEIATLPILG